MYTFELKYLPGKYMYIADLLSRNFIDKRTKEDDSMKDIVHSLRVLEVTTTNERFNEFVKETAMDETLKKVVISYQNGWDQKIANDDEFKHYYKLRSEIVVENNLVYFGNRLIVPRKSRRYVIEKLHETHLGSAKMIKTAKQVFSWPGMVAQIENYALACLICQKFSRSKVKGPLLSHEIPELPFNKVGVDIAEHAGNSYLIVIDYYSRWVEICKLKYKTSTCVIQKLKEIFSKYGIPKTMVRDNMPFGSIEFIKFAKEWQFEIMTSSPNFPKSNGLGEKVWLQNKFTKRWIKGEIVKTLKLFSKG